MLWRICFDAVSACVYSAATTPTAAVIVVHVASVAHAIAHVATVDLVIVDHVTVARWTVMVVANLNNCFSVVTVLDLFR